MRSLRNVGLTAAVASMGLLTSSVSAVTWDFQSDTVGSGPTNGVVYSNLQVDTQVTVVDAASSPADPFGGAGNQSLMMSDSNLTTNATYTFGVASGNGFSQGTLSARMYIVDVTEGDNEPAADYQYFNINAGIGSANTGAGDIGPWLVYNNENIQFNAFTMNGIIPLTNAIPFNTAFDLVINFDTATHSFSGTLDGVPLTDGVNTTFSFFNAINTLESVRVVQSESSQSAPNATTYYDDITLVPEPAALGLLAMGWVLIRRGNRR